MNKSLWNYCSKKQEQDFLLSLKLTGSLTDCPRKQLALLYHLANHADKHYQKISIPKPNGGCRTLMVPDSLLKYVQTQILHQVLESQSISPYACAYKKGVRLSQNALPHQQKKILLKLDIQDFFGSITYISVYQHGFRQELFPASVRTLLAHLCCYKDTLPQGAPASPYLSNLVMKPFDEYMGKWCEERSVSYTRYCDDMTFSGDFQPHILIKKAEAFLNRLGFQLKDEKTHIYTQKNRQEVTGIVVNEKLQTPRHYRRQIRQECYYIKKFGIQEHLKHINYPGKKEKYLESLLGKILYVLQINPQDEEFLRLKQEFADFK